MSHPTVLSVTDFNPVVHIGYGQMKQNSGKGKSMEIFNAVLSTNVSSKTVPLRIITPTMKTWGVNEEYPDKLSLMFAKDEYQTEDERIFQTKMAAMNNKILNDMFENYSVQIANKKITNLEVMQSKMTPILKYRMLDGYIDPTKPPTMSVKLPSWTNADTGVTSHRFDVYNAEDRKIFPTSDPDVTIFDAIPKSANVTAIMECGGIWVSNGNFGVTWKLVQVLVEANQSLYGRCLIPPSIKSAPSASSKAAGGVESITAAIASLSIKKAAPSRAQTYDSDEDQKADAIADDVAAVIKQEIAAVTTAATAATASTKRVIKRRDDPAVDSSVKSVTEESFVAESSPEDSTI